MATIYNGSDGNTIISGYSGSITITTDDYRTFVTTIQGNFNSQTSVQINVGSENIVDKTYSAGGVYDTQTKQINNALTPATYNITINNAVKGTFTVPILFTIISTESEPNVCYVKASNYNSDISTYITQGTNSSAYCPEFDKTWINVSNGCKLTFKELTAKDITINVNGSNKSYTLTSYVLFDYVTKQNGSVVNNILSSSSSAGNNSYQIKRSNLSESYTTELTYTVKYKLKQGNNTWLSGIGTSVGVSESSYDTDGKEFTKVITLPKKQDASGNSLVIDLNFDNKWAITANFQSDVFWAKLQTGGASGQAQAFQLNNSGGNLPSSVSGFGWSFTDHEFSGSWFNSSNQVVTNYSAPTQDMVFTAKWNYTAQPSINTVNYKTFSVDVNGASKFLFSTSSSIPSASSSSWGTSTSKTLTATSKETWYAFVQDSLGNVSSKSASITNFKISLQIGSGTELSVTSNGENVQSKYVLKNSTVKPSANLVSGYQTLTLKMNGTVISNNSNQTITSDTTFSTSADEITKQIVYKENGHGTAPAQASMTTSSATIAASAISADGWIFKHWNTASDNSGISYAPGETIKPANVVPIEDIILYAIWEQEQIHTDTYTVELENVSYIKNNSSYEKIPYETSYANASGYIKIECRIPAYVKIIVKKNGTKITPDFISDTYGSPYSIKKVQPIRNDIYRIYMGQNADLQISNNANYSITIKAIANDFEKQMFAGMTLDSNSYASTATLGFYYPSTDDTYAYQYSADYPKYIKTCDYTPAPQYGQPMQNANGHYMFIYAAANNNNIKRWFNVGDKYYVLLMGSNDTYYGSSKGSLVKNVRENGTRLSQVGSICYGNHGEAYKSMNFCPKGLAIWDASQLEYFVPMSDWGWFFKDGSNYVNDNGDIYSGTDYSFERWVSYSYGSWSKAFIFSPNAPLKSMSWKETTIGADSTQNSYMLIKTNVEDLIENPITYNGGIKKGNDNLLLDTNGKKWNNHTITSLKEDSNDVGNIQPIWWDWNGSTWNQVTYYNKLQWVALLYDSVEVQRKIDNQAYAPNITIGFIIYHYTLFSPNLNWINATQSGSNIRGESYVVFKGVCQNDGTIIAQTTDLVQSPSAFYAKYECGELSASGHTFHDVIINNYSAEELSAIIYVLYADNNWQIINTLPTISNENRISSYGDRVFGKQLKLLFKNTTSTNTITTLTNTNSHLVDDGNTYGDAIKPGYDFEVHDEEMIKEGIFKVISEI